MDGGASFVAGYKINNALELGIGAGAQYVQALTFKVGFKF